MVSSTPSIAAAIITYNPDVQRLAENIRAIAPQTESILIVDNGSANIQAIRQLATAFPNIDIYCNPSNVGIATALNQAAEWGCSHRIAWLLTLDQDSVCPSDIIANYSRHLHHPHLGMLCCRVIDRNVGELLQTPLQGALQIIDECITSASLLNLSAWKKAGRFCDEMFIDAVDFDYCYLLQAAGFLIMRDNSVCLYHEVGHSTTVNVLGKVLYLFHHPPLRNYYITRNTLYLGQRHHRRLHFAFIAAKRALLILLFESKKLENLYAISQAVFHACTGRYGQRPS